MSLLSSCLWVIFFPHGPKQEKIRKKVTQPAMNMLVSKLRWKPRRLCNFQAEEIPHWPVWDSQLSQKEISLCWLTLGYPAYTHTKWTHKHLPRRGAEQRLKLKRCLSLPHWPGVGHRHPYILRLPHCWTAVGFPFSPLYYMPWLWGQWLIWISIRTSGPDVAAEQTFIWRTCQWINEQMSKWEDG